MKKVCIMSAKFSPGHFSHLLAFYKLFESLNYEPCLYLAPKYREFSKDYPEYKKKYIQKDQVDYSDILFIYNLSIHDNWLIKRFKRVNKQIKIYFVYHEPWTGVRNMFKEGFTKTESGFNLLKQLGRYIFGIGVLRNSHCILLSSEKAVNCYIRYCKKINSNYKYFPLIFNDEAMNADLQQPEKKYFSFVATVSLVRNFSYFIQYIKHLSKVDDTSYFQIATSSNIEKYIDADLKELEKSGRLIINSGHPLSIKEINYAYAISKCIWLIYRRSIQSGVLCKAFMFGSPVLASNVGSFPEFVNKTNGIVLDKSLCFEDIDDAYQRISENLANFSKGARETFLDNFYWENKKQDFMKIID